MTRALLLLATIASVALACSSSSTGGGAGPLAAEPSLPMCMNPSAELVACNSCVETTCSSLIAKVATDCSAYASCYAACDCSDLECVASCAPLRTSACDAASSEPCTPCDQACSALGPEDAGLHGLPEGSTVRPGPDASVACGGVPTPCSLLDAVTCGSSPGCAPAAVCTGLPSECSFLADAASCGAQQGCFWEGQACAGFATECSTIAADLCALQQGCDPGEPICGGVATTLCEALGAADCGSVPGCLVD
jgi:hypothetical protein